MTALPLPSTRTAVNSVEQVATAWRRVIERRVPSRRTFRSVPPVRLHFSSAPSRDPALSPAVRTGLLMSYHSVVAPVGVPAQSPLSASPSSSSSFNASAGIFYRRPLPPQCIDFSSPHGKRIFGEALASGYMECFFMLAAQFRTQDEPAFCGLSTLVMVLNALCVDPGRTVCVDACLSDPVVAGGRHSLLCILFLLKGGGAW